MSKLDKKFEQMKKLDNIEDKIQLISEDVNLFYIASPPNKWTFQPPRIRKIIELELNGKVLNLFAGKTKLNHPDGEIIRVDRDEEKEADYNMTALDYLNETEEKFDTVLLDPPYNVRKSREKYEGKYMGNFTRIKNKLKGRIKENGKVITFGYATTGMSASRGFNKKRGYIINHKGDHNDTLAIVEIKS